jgi:hypothetical protein
MSPEGIGEHAKRDFLIKTFFIKISYQCANHWMIIFRTNYTHRHFAQFFPSCYFWITNLALELSVSKWTIQLSRTSDRNAIGILAPDRAQSSPILGLLLPFLWMLCGPRTPGATLMRHLGVRNTPLTYIIPYMANPVEMIWIHRSDPILWISMTNEAAERYSLTSSSRC